jgi:hypothetical protein
MITVGRAERDGKGRWLTRPPGSAPIFKPGNIANPEGKSGIHGEMQRRARECSVEVVEFLIGVVRDPHEDTRNRVVAAGMILDRAALSGRAGKRAAAGQCLPPFPSLSTIVRDYWFDATGPGSMMWRTNSAVWLGSSAVPNTAQASRPAAARPM